MEPEVLPLKDHDDMALEEMSNRTANHLQIDPNTYRPQTSRICHLQHPELQMVWVT
jgi:hypothetical protein